MSRPSLSKKASPRALKGRQRQRLIDASITALYRYGPSKTTVAKVVQVAKLSPGIVRFYFATKDAMLIATLEFLAKEFEQQLSNPVAAAEHDPLSALVLLVEQYLGEQLATPRKVSVWYSFWGEANSRAEYLDICGQRDQKFELLVLHLIERLLQRYPNPNYDAQAIAMGLIGILEVLWQFIAFKDDSQIDRMALKAQAFKYLSSLFPMAPWPQAVKPTSATRLGAWQVVATRDEIPLSGGLCVETQLGSLLLWADPASHAGHAQHGEGVIRASFNQCPSDGQRVSAAGVFKPELSCALHGHALADLLNKDADRLLEVKLAQELVLVRLHATA
jgi:TetR/AcrR family transcriptional regulator, transcriptional repressor of bet genes